MGDELLAYYNRELTFIRHFAAKFAEDHPKIAERLRLNPDDAAADPHVERLIEAFAYLTARIRHKLDDDFPEITASLMDVLYPHYQAPIPSMAIVKFVLDPEQVQLTGGYTIPPAPSWKPSRSTESRAGFGRVTRSPSGPSRCSKRTSPSRRLRHQPPLFRARRWRCSAWCCPASFRRRPSAH